MSDGCGAQVRAHAPEVLVLMQCGASAQGALACVTELAALPGWWGLPAVKSGCVFVVDHAPFLRPGPRVVRRSLHPLQYASAHHSYLLKSYSLGQQLSLKSVLSDIMKRALEMSDPAAT